MATIIAIIAAVAFWLEYRENKILNEAQFIMELNEQFINNRELSNIEWELEKYYNHVCEQTLSEEYSNSFAEIFNLENPKRQHLVNYLVHLEGIAALINNGVIHFDAINDLMAYRYFIAVNNPIVQKLELLKFPNYYKGCFEIYDSWVASLKTQDIPMYSEDNDLSKLVNHKTPSNTYSDRKDNRKRCK